MTAATELFFFWWTTKPWVLWLLSLLFARLLYYCNIDRQLRYEHMRWSVGGVKSSLQTALGGSTCIRCQRPPSGGPQRCGARRTSITWAAPDNIRVEAHAWHDRSQGFLYFCPHVLKQSAYATAQIGFDGKGTKITYVHWGLWPLTPSPHPLFCTMVYHE